MFSTKSVAIGVAVILSGMAVSISTPALAFGFLTVTEDPALGVTVTVPTSVTPVIVASDGEAVFRPFNLTFDVSDAISLNGSWAPDPAYAAAFAPGGWTQLAGTHIWYLPACGANGVCENGNVFEPTGKWDFTPGGQWGPGALNVAMLDTDGTLSDLILIANDGPGGEATVSFTSGVPEPATWAMLLLGFGVIGTAMRKRHTIRSQTVALALS